MGGGSKGGGSPNIPRPPSIGKSYQKGAKVYLKYLPQFLAAEDKYRTEEDPKRIAAQQALQEQYGPTQYAQQRQALQQLDPQWFQTHEALGKTVMDDLSSGYGLTPGLQNQVEQNVRGSQAARGNIYGDSAGMAEGYALGDRGVQLYNQRIQNAGNFLGGPSVPQQLSQVSPVSPDRNFAYADPNAGWQGLNAANARYQGQVGAATANQSSGGGGWGSTLSTIGQIAGIAAMFMSDRRIKKNITKLGEGPRGVGIYKFAMKHSPGQKQIGLIAQDVQKHVPGAVTTDPATGLKAVDYAKAAGLPGPMRIK